MEATALQTVAFDGKCNNKRALYRRHSIRFGHTVWAHGWAHSARFSLGLSRKWKENDASTRRGCGAKSSLIEPAIRLVGSVSLSHVPSTFFAAGLS